MSCRVLKGGIQNLKNLVQKSISSKEVIAFRELTYLAARRQLLGIIFENKASKTLSSYQKKTLLQKNVLLN